MEKCVTHPQAAAPPLLMPLIMVIKTRFQFPASDKLDTTTMQHTTNKVSKRNQAVTEKKRHVKAGALQVRVHYSCFIYFPVKSLM